MKSNYLSDFMSSRKNNLDIIRFISAVLVILSHSYPLVQQNNNNEPLFLFTNQSTFGGLAVAIFFIISGFLIAQSYEKSNNLSTYLKARVLRIFPGLIVCMFVIALILGPMLTTLPFNDYFSNHLLYKYFIGLALLPNLSPYLPGVFVNNPFGSFVNGSLWTLKFEFFFYIVVAFLGINKILNKKFVGFFFIVCLIVATLDINTNIHNLFVLGSYFYGGTLFYLYRSSIPLKNIYATVSLIIILITAKFGYFNTAIAILGTYLVMYIGFQQRFTFPNFAKYGDFSYGLYIYAFPIQQAIIQIYEITTPLYVFLLAFPITLILSIISWYMVEKRALKLKYLTLKKLPLSKLVS